MYVYVWTIITHLKLFFYKLCQKKKEKKKLRKSHKIIHNLHKKIQHKTKVADLLKQTFLMI